MTADYRQLSLFPQEAETEKETVIPTDNRPPEPVTWNLWHGCSSGCSRCYMFRRDLEYGKDPTHVHKTASFNLPVRKYRSGPYRGAYKIPKGSTVYRYVNST